MGTSISEIQKLIDDDKELAHDVAIFAQAEVNEAEVLGPWVEETITGEMTEILRQQTEHKNQRLQALNEIARHYYFRRVDVCTNGATEKVRYLVSRNRIPGGFLSEDDWMVVSWTSPITAKILDASVGSQFEFQPARGRCWTGKIDQYAKFGTILPQLEDTTYGLSTGEVYIADEASLAQLDVAGDAGARPEPEYAATEDFGLNEIIELADRTQRAAMHLPFRETVLIEGPPGSGKTSIGLMRVPCLIDQQWDELALDRKTDRPFHRHSSMQVLVMNEEMIQYLQSLISSVGVTGIGVSTVGKFFQQVWRRSGLPGGQIRNESRSLTRLKFHSQTLQVYWSGFQTFLVDRWRNRSQELQDYLGSIDPAGLTLFRTLGLWVQDVQETDGCGDLQYVNLAKRLTEWWNRSLREAGLHESQLDVDSRSLSRQRSLRELRSKLPSLVKRMFDRRGTVSKMVELETFEELCHDVCRDAQDEVAAEWLAQTEGDRQWISEGDRVINAWLATNLMLVSPNAAKPVVGDRKPLLTHIMIDEAQDISPSHAIVLKQMLATEGTLTLVGDLRQRVSERGHFHNWSALGLADIQRAVFAVNHRQSQPLGSFVAGLHKALYGMAPDWKPSGRSNAPKPRIRTTPSNRGLAEIAAQESAHWRQLVPGATVGVLFHGKKRSGLRDLARAVEERLAESLTEVRFAVGRGRASELNQTDCVIVASVPGTKGLEFDAVVVIDPDGTWRSPIEQISVLRRNGMYVAASRAKQGLSLVVHPDSELLKSDALADLYEYGDMVAP